MKIIFFTFFCLLMVKAPAQGVNEKDTKPAKTVLMTLKISKTGGGYGISIKNMRVVEGLKKTTTETTTILQEEDLAFFILDKSKNVMDTLRIKQPLQARYEYPNKDGTISSKIVELKENEILVRYPYNPAMKYLQLIKPEANRKLISLADLIELPEVTN